MKAAEAVGMRFGNLVVTGISRDGSDEARNYLITKCDCGAESIMEVRRVVPDAPGAKGKNKMTSCGKCARTNYTATIQKSRDAFEQVGGLTQPTCDDQQVFSPELFDEILSYYPDFTPAVMYLKNKNKLKSGLKIGHSEILGFSDEKDEDMQVIMRCDECKQIYKAHLETIRTKHKKGDVYNCRSHRIQSAARKA